MRRLHKLQQETQKSLREYQRRYKNEFDGNVSVKIALRRGDLVYVDRPRTGRWKHRQNDNVNQETSSVQDNRAAPSSKGLTPNCGARV